jgi:hypothetical protein
VLPGAAEVDDLAVGRQALIDLGERMVGRALIDLEPSSSIAGSRGFTREGEMERQFLLLSVDDGQIIQIEPPPLPDDVDVIDLLAPPLDEDPALLPETGGTDGHHPPTGVDDLKRTDEPGENEIPQERGEAEGATAPDEPTE